MIRTNEIYHFNRDRLFGPEHYAYAVIICQIKEGRTWPKDRVEGIHNSLVGWCFEREMGLFPYELSGPIIVATISNKTAVIGDITLSQDSYNPEAADVRRDLYHVGVWMRRTIDLYFTNLEQLFREQNHAYAVMIYPSKEGRITPGDGTRVYTRLAL